ncbi:hypothetical protein [Histidinibacterium lentulum]|uniref:Uncharacterized protein n=1 Tax=Histidinibacterium lentulum TaxID=2480588 RepID=A0A3N2R5A6_9RHOB|nr:hypothetical protein [Histidinibacterium lentulum]ROU02669.1 hypothetical protein EAT49_10120 [Histidinibacterium lentulum]
MTIQDIPRQDSRADRAGRRVRRLGLVLGGGTALAVLVLNGVGAAECLSVGGTIQAGGVTVTCINDYSSMNRVPALIPIAG